MLVLDTGVEQFYLFRDGEEAQMYTLIGEKKHGLHKEIIGKIKYNNSVKRAFFLSSLDKAPLEIEVLSRVLKVAKHKLIETHGLMTR